MLLYLHVAYLGGFFVASRVQKLNMLAILFLLAGAAISAPVALNAADEFELARNPETVGAYVEEYFADAPVMADIAWCESRNRHYGADGKIFRGVVNDRDIGIMQINTDFHEKTAKEMGLNLYTLNDNLAYARYLYEKQGTRPWNSSKPCWGK